MNITDNTVFMYQISGVISWNHYRVDISDNTVFMYQISGVISCNHYRVDISDNTVFMYQISGVVLGAITLIYQRQVEGYISCQVKHPLQDKEQISVISHRTGI